jgi:hypothetical protein
MSEFRNVFACLVHESQECVIDLVRNLRYLDPDSLVLLYNGGKDERLLHGGFPFEAHGAIVHPSPQPQSWGRLHGFALDCMQWAIDHGPFNALTIVDSDQLGVRQGYAAFLAQFFARVPGLGLAGNVPGVQSRTTRVGPVIAAYKELELWRPFLARFAGGLEKFAHWSFWPSTVFSADAARDLTRLFATDRQLQDIMGRSQIWATEEVIFPTLVALLGYQVAESPCSYEYVKHRVPYSTRDADRALARPSVFWMHPVNRRYDDRLRSHLRDRLRHYEMVSPGDGRLESTIMDTPAARPLLLTVPILERMRAIEGWLEDDEADLLIAIMTRMLADLAPPHAVVEIGSYCGRSTVVFGSVLRSLAPEARIYAVDPHDGVVGALDRGLRAGTSTLARFERNIAAAGLRDLVVTIQQRSFEVEWTQPISLLFIDGLHDYANVARDFHHFESHVVPGGYVAFHDYADYYPGVKAFVNEQLGTGAWERVLCVRSMMVLRRRPGGRRGGRRAAANEAGERAPAAPSPAAAVAARDEALPLVTCLMPTYNRRLFVPQAIRCFLAQDYPNKELIIVDDGEERVGPEASAADLIRYVALDQRQSLGAKRNLAADLARGAILAHWDDDDWYGPHYLTRLVAALVQKGPESLVGVSRYLVYLLSSRSLKICVSRGPAGATFCYWRRTWERQPYRDTPRAEDFFFLEDARPRVHGLNEPEQFAVIRHRNHTWTRENGRDVTRRLSGLPPYRKPFAGIVGAEAAAFYERARRTLFTDVEVPA